MVNLSHDHAERFLEPVLPHLIRGFPDIAWPIIGGAITSDRKVAWRLEYVLGSLSRSSGRQDAAILELPEDALFAWCHAHPETAPAFVGTVAPVLTNYESGGRDCVPHPIMARLLDEFGAREDVLDAVGLNLRSYTGWGSPSSHYARYAGTLASLRDGHPLPQVRRWAAKVSGTSLPWGRDSIVRMTNGTRGLSFRVPRVVRFGRRGGHGGVASGRLRREFGDLRGPLDVVGASGKLRLAQRGDGGVDGLSEGHRCRPQASVLAAFWGSVRGAGRGGRLPVFLGLPANLGPEPEFARLRFVPGAS